MKTERANTTNTDVKHTNRKQRIQTYKGEQTKQEKPREDNNVKQASQNKHTKNKQNTTR